MTWMLDRARFLLFACVSMVAACHCPAFGQARSDSLNLNTGVFGATLEGAEVFKVAILWEFQVERPGGGQIHLPLPNGPVFDVCTFQWRPSQPVISVLDRKPDLQVVLDEEKLSRLPQVQHVPFAAGKGELIDGALYGIRLLAHTYSPTVYVVATFRDTVTVSAGKVEPTGPLGGSRGCFSRDESYVNWESESIKDFVLRLTGAAREFPNNDHSPATANILKALVLWSQGRHDSSDSAPRVASTVVSFEKANCYGFANLAQAVLAREEVGSRAACGVLAPFTGLGHKPTGTGGGLHVTVEYRTPCSWGTMDPQFSDNMSLPMVRLASARESKALEAWASGNVRHTQTSYLVRSTREPVVVGPGRTSRELKQQGGGGRYAPLVEGSKYYRQFESPGRCAELCNVLWHTSQWEPCVNSK